MANRHKGEVSFTAGGENYTLVLDFNAICEIEDAFGVSASELGQVIGAKTGNFRTLFRIGLSRHHGLNDIEAGDIINEIGADKASSIVAEAFKASFPDDKNQSGNVKKVGRLQAD
ncbi:hypothetical protein NDN16_20630 [Aureimonas altamirensis]|uniref:hypothetical protein n=1 Tax=Aureimonas altamirensis TaxID=370622 RepID=UPI002036A6AD|nr:hypothetical protein [Aureimonas altamirensis]MCM2506064.1 hypothetical protein [Aureimonas altamirensis]